MFAFDTVELEIRKGRRNSSCSGEMHRYEEEDRRRRQLTRRYLTLRHESVGSEQD